MPKSANMSLLKASIHSSADDVPTVPDPGTFTVARLLPILPQIDDTPTVPDQGTVDVPMHLPTLPPLKDALTYKINFC